MTKKTKKNKDQAVDNHEMLQENHSQQKSKHVSITHNLKYHFKKSHKKQNDNHDFHADQIEMINEKHKKIIKLIDAIKPKGSIDSFSVHDFKVLIRDKSFDGIGLDLYEHNNKYTIQLDDMTLGFHPPHGTKESVDKKFLSNLCKILSKKNDDLLKTLEEIKADKAKLSLSHEETKSDNSSKHHMSSTYAGLFKKQKHKTEELPPISLSDKISN